MTLWRLIWREIRHRKLNFALGAVSVLVAVGGLVAAAGLLKAHDLRTEHLVAEKQRSAEAQMRQMEEEYRKITVRMGFNIFILPKEQNLEDFYAQDYALRFMPESYADVLARSRVVTVQHLLPILQQKIKWPEQERSILLVGTKGEVALPTRDPKKPILQPVSPGSAIVGYELHRSLKLKSGDTLTLKGRSFKVQSCQGERGTKDDITLWINLNEAQELLDKKEQINCIMALECECAMADLAKVREEIARLLPDTKVVELAGNALARAEARREARRNAEAVLAREKQGRADLRREKERLAAILVPLVIAGCAVWVALLAYGNVRARRVEIGILRALGLRARQILLLFLGKAALLGLLGAAIGIVAGLAAAILAGGAPDGASLVPLADRQLLLAALLLTPLLSAVASWIPALLASQQDPATVLREE